MRMAADHLVGDDAGNIRETERTGLLGHPGVIDDLKQQISELVRKCCGITPSDGVGDLVGLLDRVGRDRVKALRLIPGASGAGIAKRRHQVEQTGDLLLRFICHGGWTGAA